MSLLICSLYQECLFLFVYLFKILLSYKVQFNYYFLSVYIATMSFLLNYFIMTCLYIISELFEGSDHFLFIFVLLFVHILPGI